MYLLNLRMQRVSAESFWEHGTGDEMLQESRAHIVKSNAKSASIKWAGAVVSGAELGVKDIRNLFLHY